jgi:Na+/citrate or Na+/malate symporter
MLVSAQHNLSFPLCGWIADVYNQHSAQDLGMVLFLAISGTLFHNAAVDKVGKILPNVESSEVGNLIAGSSSKAFQALSDEQKALVIPEIASAMTSVWAFFLAAAALSVVCSVPLVVSYLFDLLSFRRVLSPDVFF